MPTVLTDETLACLLEIAGLAVMDAQKAELRTIQESLAAMKARVRQPRGRMASRRRQPPGLHHVTGREWPARGATERRPGRQTTA